MRMVIIRNIEFTLIYYYLNYIKKEKIKRKERKKQVEDVPGVLGKKVKKNGVGKKSLVDEKEGKKESLMFWMNKI